MHEGGVIANNIGDRTERMTRREHHSHRKRANAERIPVREQPIERSIDVEGNRLKHAAVLGQASTITAAARAWHSGATRVTELMLDWPPAGAPRRSCVSGIQEPFNGT
jgi:hypothetical protein